MKIAVAAALVLVLSACSAPLAPPPDGSAPPSAEATPVAESPYEPCDDANALALPSLYPGEVLDEPSGDYYPDYLPLPSCVLEDVDFDDGTVIFMPATETDFETLEAAIVAEQGAGVPSDGQGLTIAGTVWDGQPVPAMFLVPASYGVTRDYIVIQFELTP